MDRRELSDPRDNATRVALKKDVSEHYRLEPHICRTCFGRIASTETFGEGGSITRLFTCTNCGASAQGSEASVMCCCGIRLRKPLENGKPGPEQVDAGIRCHENDNARPDFPALYVASHRGGSD